MVHSRDTQKRKILLAKGCLGNKYKSFLIWAEAPFVNSFCGQVVVPRPFFFSVVCVRVCFFGWSPAPTRAFWAGLYREWIFFLFGSISSDQAGQMAGVSLTATFVEGDWQEGEEAQQRTKLSVICYLSIMILVMVISRCRDRLFGRKQLISRNMWAVAQKQHTCLAKYVGRWCRFLETFVRGTFN